MSLTLIVFAAVLATAGGVALYARQAIVSPEAFADRSVQALEDDAVRRVVTTEIVVQVIDRGTTDVISARPVIESVVDFVIRTEPFERVFRTAALEAHRVLFVRSDENVAFDLTDAGTIVSSALRGVAPDLARQVPPDLDARLLDFRSRPFATDTLRFADRVRALGLVLPTLAFALFAAAVTIAPDRRRAITRAGLAIGVAAAGVVIALVVVEAWITANIYGEDELTNDDVRGAFGGLWSAYLGSLAGWALGVGALGLLVAAAAASLLRPFTAATGLARLRRAVRPPDAPAARAAYGAVALGLGVFVVLQPTLAQRVIAVVGGALLVYYGAGVLLSAIDSPERRAARAAAPAGGRRRAPAVIAGTAVAVLAGGVGLALAIGGGDEASERASNPAVCNGYAELCDRRLDQVAFAGAHNAMSDADTRGWLLVNQRRTIDRQLRDGIRLFLVDPHYGVQDASGKVRTDFEAEERDLNRVSKDLSPEAVAAVGRLGGRLGLGEAEAAPPDVWLCHSVCELGATKMADALKTIKRFLDRNPGEVVVIFSEDYVKEADLDRVYRETGLRSKLVELRRSEPLPTLRELVDADRRVIVLTERVPSGEYRWNNEGFAWAQDTPLGAKKANEFSCASARGEPDSPLLMVNHWIDRFPPPLGANRPILRQAFIERRLRRCRFERGLFPNLVATDFYDQSGLVEAVRSLNRVDDVPPAPVR